MNDTHLMHKDEGFRNLSGPLKSLLDVKVFWVCLEGKLGDYCLGHIQGGCRIHKVRDIVGLRGALRDSRIARRFSVRLR